MKESDVRIEVYRAGVGPGNQTVTFGPEVAVRVTHIPTGIQVVEEGRSNESRACRERAVARLAILVEDTDNV